MASFIVSTKQEIGGKVAKRVEEIVTENQAQSRRTSIAVSGSSQPGLLAPFFLELAVDWSLVDFFFSDERCVALDHPDSNYGAWNKLLFEKKEIPKENIRAIRSTLIIPEMIAEEYEKKLQCLPKQDGYPVFDIIILGMGPDGHTCSLFPGYPELYITTTSVASVLDSPKPPAERITLTLPVLNHAQHVFFLVTGGDKAPVVQAIKEGKTQVPAARVNPENGELVWFVDDAAMGN